MIGRFLAIANWHADKAALAYGKKDMDGYFRHILICDALRLLAGEL